MLGKTPVDITLENNELAKVSKRGAYWSVTIFSIPIPKHSTCLKSIVNR